MVWYGMVWYGMILCFDINYNCSRTPGISPALASKVKTELIVLTRASFNIDRDENTAINSLRARTSWKKYAAIRPSAILNALDHSPPTNTLHIRTLTYPRSPALIHSLALTAIQYRILTAQRRRHIAQLFRMVPLFKRVQTAEAQAITGFFDTYREVRGFNVMLCCVIHVICQYRHGLSEKKAFCLTASSPI